MTKQKEKSLKKPTSSLLGTGEKKKPSAFAFGSGATAPPAPPSAPSTPAPSTAHSGVGSSPSTAKFRSASLDSITAQPQFRDPIQVDDKLIDLAYSIRDRGLIEPLVVYQEGVNHYILISGERRYRAMLWLRDNEGITERPDIVVAKKEDRFLIQAHENIQRESFAHHEMVRVVEFFKHNDSRTGELLDKPISSQAVAKLLNINRRTVTAYLSFGSWHKDLKGLFSDNVVTSSRTIAVMNSFYEHGLVKIGEYLCRVAREGVLYEREALTALRVYILEGENPGAPDRREAIVIKALEVAPLTRKADISLLARYLDSGGSLDDLNGATAPHSDDDTAARRAAVEFLSSAIYQKRGSSDPAFNTDSRDGGNDSSAPTASDTSVGAASYTDDEETPGSAAEEPVSRKIRENEMPLDKLFRRGRVLLFDENGDSHCGDIVEVVVSWPDGSTTNEPLSTLFLDPSDATRL